jgi:hypothetical protein
VVVDVGRAGGSAQGEALRIASRVVILTGQTVRSVGATAAALADLPDRRGDLVVRTAKSGVISPAAAAENLGSRLLGTIPSSPALVAMADRGVPPGAGGARAWAKACRRLVERLDGGGQRSSGRPAESGQPAAGPGRFELVRRRWRR